MAVFLIQDIFRIMGSGVWLSGRVGGGILYSGMKADIGGRTIEIKSIQKGAGFDSSIPLAEAKAEDGTLTVNVRLVSKDGGGFLKKIFTKGDKELELLRSLGSKQIEFF